jgi:immunoglobulin-like protein involved in spore germination/sporulation and spore germination protein
MRLRLLATVIAGLLASSCAGGQGGTPGPQTSSPSASVSPSPTGSPTTSPSPTRRLTFEVWFTRGGRLFPSRRTKPFEPSVGRLALTAMLQGPNGPERNAGLATAVPDRTVLRGLTIRDSVATVDLSADFGSPGTATSEKLRVTQVVFTLTQFPTVRSVLVRVDGQTVTAFGSSRFPLDRPLKRRSFESLLPAIVVTAPAIGAAVSSPVVVKGTANVFEATVSLRILDARGREIVKSFTTATCGTGCRGDYSKAIRFSVSEGQPGTIVVFEASAQDGRPINVVRIPVTLLP